MPKTPIPADSVMPCYRLDILDSMTRDEWKQVYYACKEKRDRTSDALTETRDLLLSAMAKFGPAACNMWR